MAFKFNPLIFSGLDLSGGSSAGMTIGGPVAGSTPYSILSIDGSSNLDEIGPLTNGQLIIGVTGGAAVPATLTGTANQVIITNGSGSITLALPQSIATSSNPSFNTLSLTAASNQLVLSTATNGLTINSGTSAAARTYTVPDVGTTGTFMMLQGAQTVTGSKTFSSTILADGTIDVTATGGTDTLNIGIASADVINIGRSGATVNIQGTTFYQNVTNLLVSDKLFTVNVGGSAASGSDSGFEIEENAVITGYVKTSPDRNSFLLKAPNTAGNVTLTPGAGGITINQSSHDPVTIGTANGLSIVGQVLSLALSSGSTTGALSSTDWNTFNNKQPAGNYITALTGDATASGPGSVPITLATVNGNVGTFGSSTSIPTFTVNAKGLITAASGNVVIAPAGTLTGTTLASNVVTSSLTSVGTLTSGTWNASVIAIAYGGTNSSAALTNGKLMSSVGGAIVESAINTADIAAVIAEGSFSAANNQAAAADITGLAFANASIRSFQTIISIALDATSDLFAQYQLNGIQKSSSWELTQEFVGDDTGVVFSITNAGQIQYTSANSAGFVSNTMKFKSITTSV